MTAAGTEKKLLANPDGWASAERLSPDGRALDITHKGKPCVIDLEKPGVLKPVAGIPKDAEVTACAWAPDGKRIVYVIGKAGFRNAEELEKFESRIVIADADGSNARVVRSAKKGKLFTGVDWR